VSTEQLEMFETPKQRSAREYHEALTAYMAERAVPGGYQCQDCGGISRNECLFWNDHGLMGSRCQAERFARNHSIYDLRRGDLARWRESSTRLRAIAAWRQHQRRNP
jgi:hypothetical protein